MPEHEPPQSSEGSKPFEITPEAVRDYLSKSMNAVHSRHYDPNTPLSKVMNGVEEVMRGTDKDAAQEMAKAVIDGIENQYRATSGQNPRLEDLRALVAQDLPEFGISSEVFETYWNEKYPADTQA